MSTLLPTPRPTTRPTVPTPQATSDEVRQFLIDFLLVMDSRMTLNEAESEARKMSLDGQALYEIPGQMWIEYFGVRGHAMFNHLQAGAYGYVSLTSDSWYKV